MDECRFGEWNRIAILGGTFDPIHFGHLVTAETVLHELRVDKVLFIPTGTPPHKTEQSVSCGEHRFRMTELAIDTHHDFEVLRIEIERTGMSYTIDTITEILKYCKKDVKLYFVTGADAIVQMHTWKQFERLLELCRFVVVNRPGFDNSELFEWISSLVRQHKSKIHLLEVPELGISSTDIRNRIKMGKSIRYLVPETVEEYICKHNLYEDVYFSRRMDWIMREMKNNLSPKRFYHTLGVASEAMRLAAGLGYDQEKAYIAALLHDCAKEIPTDEKLRLCEEYGIEVDAQMQKNPDLLHSFLGAEMARRKYFVLDDDIDSAIRYHTTGRKKMGLLDKILFVSDSIEPNREIYDPRLIRMRELVWVDVNSAIVEGLELKMEFAKSKKREIHPLSLEALAYYKKTEKQDKKTKDKKHKK